MRHALLALILFCSGCGTVGWTSTDTAELPPATLAPVHSGPVAVRMAIKNFPETGPGSDRRIRWARAFVNAEPNGVFSLGNSPLIFDHQVERRAMEVLRELLPQAERREHRPDELRVELTIQRGIPRANRLINQVWSRLSYATLTALPHWGRDMISVQAILVDPSGKILAKAEAQAAYHQFTWALMLVPVASFETEPVVARSATPRGGPRAGCKPPKPPRKLEPGAHVAAVDAAIRLCLARLGRHPAWRAPSQ